MERHTAQPTGHPAAQVPGSIQQRTRTPGVTTLSYPQSSSDKPPQARLTQHLLAILIAVVYSGGFLFLISVSSYLLYGFYLALLVLALLCVLADDQRVRNLRAVAPYLCWLTFYGLWGTLISPVNGVIFPETVRMLVRSVLILGALVIAVPDRAAFRVLARWLHVVVILNFALAVWEAFDSTIITNIAYTLDPHATAFSEFRPAGLWSNPDEAAFAFLFALVISVNQRGVLIWMSRIAAVGGIYLGASRAGAYILVLFGIVLLISKLRKVRVTALHLSAGAIGLAGLLLLMPLVLPLIQFDPTQNWSFNRILDVTESSTGSGLARSQLTAAVFNEVLDAPIQGYGLFAFQGVGRRTGQLSDSILGEANAGAHNIYLSVWGETGLLGLVSYLLLLGGMLGSMIRTRLAWRERIIASLMWVAYLMIGFVWHDLFTSVLGIVLTGIVYYYPLIMQVPADGTRTVAAERVGRGARPLVSGPRTVRRSARAEGMVTE